MEVEFHVRMETTLTGPHADKKKSCVNMMRMWLFDRCDVLKQQELNLLATS